LYTEKSSSYQPEITFQKINPTEYLVHVDTTEPFFLVFSESNHPDWKAYHGKVNWIEAFFRKPVSADNHYRVNGFANAWYIDKTGNYDITLFFRPQSWFYSGAVISVLSFVGSIGYLGWRRRRESSLVKHRKRLYPK
jgi:hypothetical protein